MLARISSSRRGDVGVVTASGELDLASAASLRQALREAATAGGAAPAVVVDLSGVELLDSVSLGMLLGARRRVLERNGLLKIVTDAAGVLRTFELTGTADLFDIVRTLDEAFAG